MRAARRLTSTASMDRMKRRISASSDCSSRQARAGTTSMSLGGGASGTSGSRIAAGAVAPS
jgi:hypothetical protein